jgi:hypothetical protein
VTGTWNGAIFPLKWLAQGMRSVFLPDPFAHRSPAGAGSCELRASSWRYAPWSADPVHADVPLDAP